MGSIARQEHYWLVQPLLEAGLDLEEIRCLVFRLGFDAVVAGAEGADWSPARVVSDQPTDVQAAWARTIGRMLELGARDEPWL